jgi:hypothetical protein
MPSFFGSLVVAVRPKVKHAAAILLFQHLTHTHTYVYIAETLLKVEQFYLLECSAV